MCGIAGVLRFDGRPVEQQLLTAMNVCQRHRGPDDAGTHLHGPLGFAFRRLAILDLSPAGHQPMHSSDGSCVLIFNGEIYNFRELRAELQARGYAFRSTTDTEVLLAAYAEWGVDCLQRLSGMFAFALWDGRHQRLLCARDRFGIKPFYYHLNAERFVFASELKTLFAEAGTLNQPNDQRIYDYLVYGHVDHSAETCFAHILQLPPAHYLLLTPGQRPGPPRRYWDIDPQRQLRISDDEAAEQFGQLFQDSVQRHLQSDVPVGTCLSGGLDSSSIVVVVNALLRAGGAGRTVIGERQKTFSACYEDLRYDERRFIQVVVDQTRVANAQVFPTGAGLLADLDAFVWHQEQPCPSTSVYAQWCVMRLARQHDVTVLLDGQGGDETLAGYPIYQAAWWATLARQGRLLQLRQELQAYGQRFGSARTLRLREALRLALPAALSEQISDWLGHRSPDWLGARLAGRHYERPGVASPLRDPLGRLLYSFLVSLNLPSLLRYEDRNSMAFSIEARVPFLDERLVELAFALPRRQLIRAGEAKWILRRALRGLLPEEVRQRQDKIGFATPGDAWLRHDLAPLVEDVLGSGSLARRGYVASAAATRLWALHRAGHLQAHQTLWRWLHLELWARRFLDQHPLQGRRA